MNLKSCTRRGGCLWYAIQAVRWFPTFLVGAILSWGYYAYVYQMCYLTISNIFQQLIYLIVFHLLLIMLVWSYYQTCMTDPASPPEAFFYNPDDEQDSAIQLMENHVQMLLERYVNLKHLPVFSTGFGGEIRYCEKCKCIKPDRSHHCSVCGTCVLRFDHHCPWVNNCVNHANYKFFVLFLGYGFTFCLWIFFTDLQFFIAFWQRELHGGPLDANLHLLFLTFVSGMFAVSLSVLFFYHLWLTSKNRSTVESFRSPIINGVSDKNAYNHGIKANYIEVFGSDPWYWFLPIFTTQGDGSTHPAPAPAASATYSNDYSVTLSVKEGGEEDGVATTNTQSNYSALASNHTSDSVMA